MQAQGEAVLRKALNELNAWGYERQFVFVSTSPDSIPQQEPTPLVKEWTNLTTEVADHQNLISSLCQSPYFPLMKDEIQVWEKRLATLLECLLSLNAIQRKWVYLEPIFSKGALPHYQSTFKQINHQFHHLMVQLKVTEQCNREFQIFLASYLLIIWV